MYVYSNPRIITLKPITYEIDKKGCWVCTSHMAIKQGYTKLHKGYLHRLVYEAEKGKITSGNVVMHSCDNPRCFNPKHLIQGTQADNVRDMMNKCRNKDRGWARVIRKKALGGDPRIILNEDKVREIVKLIESKKYKHQEIAHMYNVAPSTISGIASGKAWRRVTKPKQ